MAVKQNSRTARRGRKLRQSLLGRTVTAMVDGVNPSFDNAILAHGDSEVDLFLRSALSLKDGERVTVRKIDINRRLKEVSPNYVICGGGYFLERVDAA